MNLDSIRREYLKDGLRRENLNADPFKQFEAWLQQSIDAGIPDPTAMVVATVGLDGTPSQRIVLLKKADQRGFVFYTNYHSRKSHDLTVNNRISLHFPWHFFERQITIEGSVQKVSYEESLEYFLSRPYESQLGAWASHQSSPISSRKVLEAQFDAVKEQYERDEVPLPDFWGGYRVVPSRYEFWQGGAKRLHDRFEYTLSATPCEGILKGGENDALSASEAYSWHVTRLSP